MREKSNFIDFENIPGNSDTAGAIATSEDSSKEEEMLKEVINKNNAKTQAGLIYKSAQDESEKLMLRNQVVEGSYSNDMKLKILDLLDGYVKEELKEEITLADSIEEIKKEKSNLLLGAVGIVVIGIIVSVFFPIAWLIGIVLAMAGYVASKNATEFLAPVLVSALQGTVTNAENHIARLLFKLAVETNMMMNVLASEVDVSPEVLERLRGRCIQEVKKTGGAVTFADAMKYQKGE